MNNILQKIQILSWSSIILGAFFVIKIPETLFSALILTKMTAVTNAVDMSQIFKSYIGIMLILALLSAGLIIGGFYLLKKKPWARNLLEGIYWILLLTSIAKIGNTVGSLVINSIDNLATSEMVFLETAIFVPLAVLMIITIIALNAIRDSNVKKILRK